MILNRLTLNNFKGIRSIDVPANGQNLAVFGDNGAGKTTIVDAFLWLLTGKDSEGRKDFEIKTLDITGEPLHNLEHTVEGVFDCFALKRTFREKWTKKRGSAEAEFTGHETLYAVDDVPCSEKEYTLRIGSKMPEEVFKLLADPYYFNEKIKWPDRRKTLLEVCGGVDLAELISSNPKFNEIPSILNGRSVDDTKKVIAAQKKKINDQLQEIPARIDEAHKSMAPVTEKPEAQLREEDRHTADEIAVINDAKARLLNGGAAIDIKNKMADINAQMSKIKAADDAKHNKSIYDLVDEIGQKRTDRSQYKNSLDIASSAKARYKNELDANVKTRESLRKEYGDVAAEAFECSVESVCPTCGQDLPEYKVEEAREKAISDFNTKKAQRLENINTQGKQLKARAEELEKLIAGLDAQIPGYEKAIADADCLIPTLESKLSELKNCVRSYGVVHDKFAEEYDTLQAKLSETAVPIGDIQKLDSEKATLESKRSDIRQELANRDSNKRLEQRIEELKANQKTIAGQYEQLERHEDLLNQFIKAQVDAIEANVNGKFQITRFKMFDQQINGGVAECCEAMVNGVPYGNINQAAKTNCGLDIINTLSKHYGLVAPIFIDRCESVTKLLPTEAQTICLYVSEADKKLRIETKGEN